MIIYLSDRVNPLNIKQLQETLYAQDGKKEGILPSDTFVRALSLCEMKFLDGEVDRLINAMVNEEKMDIVNY